MAIEEIDATFVADSTVSANGAALYAAGSTMAADSSAGCAPGLLFSVVSTMVGDSTAAATGGLSLAASSTMVGDASAVISGSAAYAAGLTMVGDSTASITPALRRQIVAAMAADSAVSATVDSDSLATLAAVAAAFLVIDPTKVTIVNFSRGPQVPVSARPLTVPTIRITPPAPVPASYSIGTPPARGPKRGL